VECWYPFILCRQNCTPFVALVNIMMHVERNLRHDGAHLALPGGPFAIFVLCGMQKLD
jgi:hypothetical protein